MSDRTDSPGRDADELRRLLRRASYQDTRERMPPAAEPPPVLSRDLEPAPPQSGEDFATIKGDLLERLLQQLGDDAQWGGGDEDLRGVVEDFVQDVLETEPLPLNEQERGRLADELIDETLGLGPLAPLMGDPAVTDILVNGPNKVYVERFGRLERTGIRFRDAEHVVRVIDRIAARVGRHIDLATPLLDARLPDSSRVNATLAPVSVDGPTLSIRRFNRRRLRSADWLRLGSSDERINGFLAEAVRSRQNVIISGGTGAGKSTLLGALSEHIPHEERIITIEDTAELILDQEHVVRLETRAPNIEGQGRITQRDLVVNALRMRPDRIVLGEVRSGEALDMLQAMNTGHDGSLSTVHANSARDALSRLETMVLMAGLELPSRAIREQIASAINLLVHVRRYEDGVRRIESVSELVGLEDATPLLNDIFRFEHQGHRGRKVQGRFVATGTVPTLADELRRRGSSLPLEWFRKPAPEGLGR